MMASYGIRETASGATNGHAQSRGAAGQLVCVSRDSSRTWSHVRAYTAFGETADNAAWHSHDAAARASFRHEGASAGFEKPYGGPQARARWSLYASRCLTGATDCFGRGCPGPVPRTCSFRQGGFSAGSAYYPNG